VKSGWPQFSCEPEGGGNNGRWSVAAHEAGLRFPGRMIEQPAFAAALRSPAMASGLVATLLYFAAFE